MLKTHNDIGNQCHGRDYREACCGRRCQRITALMVPVLALLLGAVPFGGAFAATNLVSQPAGLTRVLVEPGAQILVSLPFMPFESSIQSVLAGQMTGASDPAAADHVLTWNPLVQQFRSAFKVAGTGNPAQDGRWFENESSWVTSSVVLYPGDAFWLENRQSMTQVVYLSGSVILDTQRVVALRSALNLFAYPFSSSIGLNESGLAADGAFGAAALTNADRITETVGHGMFWLLNNPASTNHGKWLDESSLLAQEELRMGQGYWYYRTQTNVLDWSEPRPYANPFPAAMELPRIVAITKGPFSNQVTVSIRALASTGSLEIYVKNLSSTDRLDTAAGWQVAQSGLAVSGTNDIHWTDADALAPQNNCSFCSRVYLAARGDVDTDSDGLPDAREQFVSQSNPQKPDTDGDGLSDAMELLRGSNPSVPDNQITAQDISAGGLAFSLYAYTNGAAFSWGNNNQGQLGIGKSGGTSSRASRVIGMATNQAPITARRVAAGGEHGLALSTGRTIWAWGDNAYGQLGNGTLVDRLLPTTVMGPVTNLAFTNVVAMDGGTHHSLAVQVDGSCWAWGRNVSGRLGDGTIVTRRSPVRVQTGAGVNLTNVAAVAAGDAHSLGVCRDGSVWAWGNNDKGQLGDGTMVVRLYATRVVGPGGTGFLAGVVGVAAGTTHSLALKGDGTVWAWGHNASGQLGSGNLVSSRWPVAVVGVGGTGRLSQIVAIAAGAQHSLALTLEGRVLSWGQNNYGQLGINSLTNRAVPSQVLNVTSNGALSNVVWISAGSEHNLVIASNRLVFAWGRNQSGQLGAGNTVNRSVPVMIDSDNDLLSDSWEATYLGGLTYGPGDDPDADGLSNSQEASYGTHPAAADTDNDTYTDGYEVARGSNPLSSTSFPRFSISGSIQYGGSQTGAIRALAVASDDTNFPYVVIVANPGAFIITNLPALRTYRVSGYRDSDGDGAWDLCEATGTSVVSSLYLTGTVSNVTVALTDDTLAPVLALPSNTVVEASLPTDPQFTGYATATDDRDPAPFITHTDHLVAGSCPGAFTISRTWTAADQCGNVAVATQFIGSVDTVAPVLTGQPGNLVLSNPDDIPSAPLMRSWGLYANNGGRSEARRDLDSPLALGQRLSLDMDNGAVMAASNTGRVGFILQDAASGSNLVEFSLAGGDTEYRLADASGTYSSGVSNSVQGLHVDFVRTGPGTFLMQVTRLEDAGGTNPATVTLSGILSGGTNVQVSRVVLFNQSAGLASPHDLFFNHLFVAGSASDDASDPAYDDEWFNGDDGGTGFGPWILAGSGGPMGDPYNYGRFCASSVQNNPTGDTNNDGDIDSSSVRAMDAGDVHVPVHFAQSDNGGSGCAGNPRTVTRTWTAADDCGNSTQHVQVITQEDTLAPVLSAQPQDLTLSCADVPAPAALYATDNAGAGDILPDDLLAYYSMNTDEGGLILDQSTNGLDAVSSGASFTGGGIAGGAYRFDGVGDYVDVMYPYSLNPRHLSVSLWFRPDSAPPAGEAVLVSREDGYSAGGYALTWEAGSLHFRLARPGTTTTLATPCSWSSGQWYHVAATFDGTAKRLYVNGTLAAETNEPSLIHYTVVDPRIGAAAGDVPSGFFAGSMDEVRIHGRALSAAEVAILHARSGSLLPASYSEVVTGLCDTVHIRTWQAMDACGNAVGWTQRITAVECDADGDALPDCWEHHFGSDPLDAGGPESTAGAEGDPDNDGYSNLEEYTNGTDPFDPADPEVLDYRVLYVSSAGTWSGDGSFTNPYPVIQEAINQAVAGDHVLIKAGYYTGYGNYDVSFLGKSLLVKGVSGAERTVIDCQGHRGFLFTSGESAGAVLEGVTLRYAKDISPNGAGIHIADASPTVRRCILELGEATQFGGGVYATNSAALISACVIRGNTAAKGAAVYMVNSPLSIMNCAIDANSSSNGGAIYCAGNSAAQIINNTIMANDAGTAGTIIVDDMSNPTVVNNIVSFNSSGIRKQAPSASLVLRNNCVYENEKGDYSGIADPTGANGNIAKDPKVGSVLYGNIYIAEDSPCLDAGDDSVVPAESTDLKDRARRAGARTDIGAIELQPPTAGSLDAARATIVRVDGVNGNDANNGSTWALAKKTIQAAVDTTPSLGDEGVEIWVRQGTYAPSVTVSIGKPHVALYGGFQGNESYRWRRSGDPLLTIIDGSASHRVLSVSGKGTLPCLVDGFTIQNGHVLAEAGAGVKMGSGVIENCVIRNNTVEGYYMSGGLGGGLACQDGKAVIRDCVITGNEAEDAGSAVYGANASPQLINCKIADNASIRGAAAVEFYNCAALVQNCTIAQNSSPHPFMGPTNRGIHASFYGGNTNVVTVRDSIVWGHDLNEVGGSTQLEVSHSIVEGAQTGEGRASSIISRDPLFADIGAGDVHLEHGSPGINAGARAAAEYGLDWEQKYGTDPDGVHGDAGIVDIGYHYGGYSATSDTDKDGLPDWWELQHFSSLAEGNPIADPDDDGFSNLDEFLAAADPLDQVEYPADVVYVDNDMAVSGAGTFLAPFQTIQEGINALPLGGVVMVKDGVYQRAGDKNLAFGNRPVSVKSQHGAAAATIDCANSGRAATLKPGCAIDGITIRNGLISSSQGFGGGLRFDGGGEARNCIIRNNVAQHPWDQGYSPPPASGGGVHFNGGGSLRNCLVAQNSAYGWYGPYGGYVAGFGGGIYSSGGGTVDNCTVINNSADNGGGVYGPVTIKNSIVWGNGIQNQASVAYSCVQDWTGGGTGNTAGDPLLVNPASLDVHLPLTSPVLDSGSDDAQDVGLGWQQGRGTNPDGVHGDGGKVDLGYHYPGYSSEAYLPDADADGLPDSWESQYFTSSIAGDPAADDDTDGFSNLAEFQGGSSPVDGVSVPPMSRLRCSGKDIVNEDGEKVLLRGVNLGSWMSYEQWMLQFVGPAEDLTQLIEFLDQQFSGQGEAMMNLFMDNYLTAEDLDVLRALGFNCVRAPFIARWLENESSPGVEKAQGYARLDWLVEQCRRRHIYVILDLHGTPGGQNPWLHSGQKSGWRNRLWDSLALQDQTVALWEKLALRYKGNAAVAGYDLFNEPEPNPYIDPTLRKPEFEEKILPLQRRLYDAIRAVDPEHLIFMMNNIAFTDMWFALDWLPSPVAEGWQDVVYEFHYYEKAGPWGDNPRDVSFAKQKALVDNLVRHVVRFSDQLDVPIYLGEFGPDLAQNFDYFMRQFNANGIHWSPWNFRHWGYDNPSDQDQAYSMWGLDYRIDGDVAANKPQLLTDSQTLLQNKFALYTHANYAPNSLLRAVVSNNTHNVTLASQRTETYYNTFGCANIYQYTENSAQWPWLLLSPWPTTSPGAFQIHAQRCRLYPAANGTALVRLRSRQEADARFEVGDAAGCWFSVKLNAILATTPGAGDDMSFELGIVRDSITNSLFNYDTEGIICRAAYDQNESQITFSLFMKDGGAFLWGEPIGSSVTVPFTADAKLELFVNTNSVTLRYNGVDQIAGAHQLELQRWPNGGVCVVAARNICGGTSYIELDDILARKVGATRPLMVSDDFDRYASGIPMLALTDQWSVQNNMSVVTDSQAMRWYTPAGTDVGSWINPHRDYQNAAWMDDPGSGVLELRALSRDLVADSYSKMAFVKEILPGELYSHYHGSALYAEIEKKPGNIVTFSLHKVDGAGSANVTLGVNWWDKWVDRSYDPNKVVSFQVSSTECRIYYGSELVVAHPHGVTLAQLFPQGLAAHLEYQTKNNPPVESRSFKLDGFNCRKLAGFTPP